MANRDYELMYIVRPTVNDDGLPAVTDRVDGMIANLGGQVTEKNPWGKRRLAYPIQDFEDGYYVVSRINLDPERTQQLEDQLRIFDDVIRHIVVRPIESKAPLKAPDAPEAQSEPDMPVAPVASVETEPEPEPDEQPDV